MNFKGLSSLSEEQLAALEILPESVRKNLERDIEKNVHTIRTHDVGNYTVQAKVGESGRVIVVQARTRDGKWLQGQRPSLQFRPSAIEALRPHMGSVGEFLGQYLDEARDAGLIDDGSDD